MDVSPSSISAFNADSTSYSAFVLPPSKQKRADFEAKTTFFWVRKTEFKSQLLLVTIKMSSTCHLLDWPPHEAAVPSN